MSDGAHDGLKPTDAMKGAMGGDTGESEHLTAGDMAAWLDAATPDESSYDEGARWTAKQMLDYLRSHHEAAKLDVDALYDAMERDGVQFLDCLTGFMVGWAANAARRCLELKPVANPAIVTLDI